MSDTGEFVCGLHTAEVWERGGTTLVGELIPLQEVRWQRIRDDISTASVILPTTQCCELLDDLRTLIHELHIVRNEVTVWQGPIIRIEYEWDHVQIFAEDVLWVAKRTILATGYDHTLEGSGSTSAINRIDADLRGQCYALHGDPWNVVAHLHPLHSSPEPQTARRVNSYQMYIWEDLDKYGEDGGIDYCVVNRDIYWFDTRYAWHVLPPLEEQFLSQFPRIVEYGNLGATRVIFTNGEGFAGIAGTTTDPIYGQIDWLINNSAEDGATTVPDEVPSAERIAGWTNSAARNLIGRNPPPVGIVIPANTTIMPGAPWRVEDLIPGSWFVASITLMCRSVSEWHVLHEVVVSENAPGGETVQFTSISAPSERIDPL